MTGGVFILLWSSPGYRTPDEERVRKMKRILIVLSALVLIFAVACNGDNPAPGGNSGGSSNDPVFDEPIEIPAAPGSATVTATQELAGKIMEILMWGDESGNQNVEATYLTQSVYYDKNGKVLATQVSNGNEEPGSKSEITLAVTVADIPAGSVITATVGESGATSYSANGSLLTEDQTNALMQVMRSTATEKTSDRTTYTFSGIEYREKTYDRWYHEFINENDPARNLYQTYMKVTTSPAIDGMTSIEVYFGSQTNMCVIKGGADAGIYSIPPEILEELFGPSEN